MGKILRERFIRESKGKYLNGKREGVWKFYHDNGNLKLQGGFKNGRRDGLVEEYYKNAELKGSGKYEDGKKIEGFWKSNTSSIQQKKSNEFIHVENAGLFENYIISNSSKDTLDQYPLIEFYYVDNNMIEHDISKNVNYFDGLWETYFKNGQLESKGLRQNSLKNTSGILLFKWTNKRSRIIY